MREVALDRRAGTGAMAWPAARSSATVPRTNARQPLARRIVVEREGVVLAEVGGVRLDPVAASSGSAVTVTPRSIANGSASPSL